MTLKLDKNKSSNFFRLFRGAYRYVHDSEQYCEENFEIFKEKKELNTHYNSEIMGRVSTGQLLKVSTEVIVNRGWIPQKVVIERSLGQNSSKETYRYNQRENLLTYKFESPHQKEMEELSTPPKFYIQTPAASSSMLFIGSKKIDQTAENHFLVYQGEDQWVYQAPPKPKNLILKRAKVGETEAIKIGEHSLNSIEYRLTEFEQLEDAKKKESPSIPKNPLYIYMSNHMNIPYKIHETENNFIEILYLNNFTDSGDNEDSNVF